MASNSNAVKMNSSMKAYSADHDWELDLTEEQEQQINAVIDQAQDKLEQVATKVGLAQVTSGDLEDDAQAFVNDHQDEVDALVKDLEDLAAEYGVELAQTENPQKTVAKKTAKHKVGLAELDEKDLAKRAAKRKIKQETGIDVDGLSADDLGDFDIDVEDIEYDEDMTVAEAEEMLNDAGVPVDDLKDEHDIDTSDIQDKTLGEIEDEVVAEAGFAQVAEDEDVPDCDDHDDEYDDEEDQE
jgi:Spy/CpxP family protein refolding chaperone